MSKILITGGAGFIGVNTAVHFAKNDWSVIIIDNLSRPGARKNLEWLNFQQSVDFVEGDIRDQSFLATTLQEKKPDAVLHLAGQVAVTTSMANPREDFETNALGTFNLLEGIRLNCPECVFINASTNKVYGKMEQYSVIEEEKRYRYQDLVGVSEQHPLDFHSPYGCSKGAADQYSIDYARVFDLRTVTLRQSCIYGQRQLGVEDQGWVAWFTIAALLKKPITIYGNGKQVRDILFVDDLVRCYEMCITRIDKVRGEAFNIGGGPSNTLSLIELLEVLDQKMDLKTDLSWDDWRPGDQPVFICDLSKVQQLLGWEPEITVDVGLEKLADWVKSNSELFDWL